MDVFMASSQYSHNVSAALDILSELRDLPKPKRTAEQRFADHAMAAALRFASEGIRLHGVGAGLTTDPRGIDACADEVLLQAHKTSAPMACTVAATCMMEHGTLPELALIAAAAAALSERDA
jgi:hypothetical protein